MSSSIAATLAHAIAYLTRPLIVQYSATTIIKLQLALEANLTAQYSTNWCPEDPLRGSGRRCLTLSPASLPPRPIHKACESANIDWSQWIKLLGGIEFDLFIDPGSVSVRFGNWAGGNKVGKCLTVWSESSSTTNFTTRPKPTMASLSLQSKTFAQQLLEDDSQEENELFAILADHVREPTWITPIKTDFPPVQSPLSAGSLSSIDRSINDSPVSAHSRSSSRSSSLFSYPDSVDSFSTSESSESKMSRRERARVAKVFIDNSRNQVTNYDGGKTTVLTGGVMLGAPSVKSKSPTSSPISKPLSAGTANWRSVRS
ncbi:hypothetical protein BJ322DRAFT_759771 [Thelephora terrestris]|uniref:Anti-proliferative protein domain-containing protein n=1 Tax=Thelephora terrestris TaxID=56493 RepID=A0A9P6L6W2_9AGAM|nr:hypothetical protein BJ322DRAFT_759771 [Thelephora terrestris]